MRIHPTDGRVLHGIGGEGVYLDGVQIAPGDGANGMPDWLNSTPIWCGATGKPFSLVRGSQVGAWAGWTPEGGVVTSWGLRLPRAVLLDMAPDGTMLVGNDYQGGMGISAYRAGSQSPSGTVPGARPEMRFPYSQAAILDGQTACWTENVNGRMVLSGYFSGSMFIGPRPPWNVLHPRLFRVTGDVWVVYLRGVDDRIIAHPWDYRGRGFIASDLGYGPDARAVGDSVTLFWSVGAGEIPGEIKSEPFSATALDEIPSPASPMPAPSAPSGRVNFAGAFFVNGETPGNCAVWVSRNGQPMAMPPTQAIIAAPELADLVPPDRLLGIWCESTAKVAECKAIAERLCVPVCAYRDTRDYGVDEYDGLMGETPWIALLQCYIDCRGKEGESLASFAAEIEAQIGTLMVPWMAVVRATAPPGFITPERTAAAMNVLAPMMTGSEGFLLFAWDRADGVTGTPELRPHADAWLTVETAVAPTSARQWASRFFAAPVPFSIRVDDFTASGVAPFRPSARYQVEGAPGAVEVLLTLDGQIVGSYDQLSGSVTAAESIGPGEYRLGLTAISNGRKTQTGTTRIVRVKEPTVPVEIPGITYPEQTGSGKPEDASNVWQQAADAAVKDETAPVVVLPSLSIQGRQFLADGALYVPRWVSGLTLLARSEAEQVVFLDWAVRTGFNGVRVFCGALTWAGQTSGSARAGLPGLLDRAASRGLVVEVTALTDTASGYDAKGHLVAVADILQGRKGVVLELANEVGHPSQDSSLTADRLLDWGREIAEPRGLLWAVGAAQTDEPISDVYETSGGRYSTAHLDRGRESWNNVRRVREIYAIVEAHKAPAVNNEPMGADELDGRQTGKQRWNDPALFYTLGALDRAFGVGGVHHSQAGLFAALPGPVQQACAESYVRAHAFISRVLPGIVGQYKNVGHAASPLVGATFAEGTLDDGVVRAYSFIAGPTGVTVIVGGKGNLGLQWGNGWRPTEDVLTLTGQDGRYAEIRRITQ